MKLIPELDVHLAVLAGKPEQSTKKAFDAAHPLIYGTAFPIAPGLFVTAAHVYRDTAADGRVALARLTGGNAEVGLVADAELFEEFDLALLVCPYFKDTRGILPVDFGRLTIFDEVAAIGFPFSIDAERLTWVHRGFKGHIVTSREMYHLPGQPPGYELSFVPPPGMSGAPLVAGSLEHPAIAGYIIQHSTHEVHGVETRLGIAITTDVFLWIDSRIVGGPLASVWGKSKTERGRITPIRNR